MNTPRHTGWFFPPFDRLFSPFSPFNRRALPAVVTADREGETVGKARRLNEDQVAGTMLRRRRGSVLIIVVALLVLMAIIGTAYVSTARIDRGAAASGTFNTQIDLLVQGVESMSQTAIWKDIATNFWTAAATPTNYTSPTEQTFLASRTPVLVNGNPAWLYISAAPITNAVFESPYNPAGTAAAPAVLQYGQDRQNMVPTSIAITDPTTGTTVQYPALIDPKYPVPPGQSPPVFLAASAAGDGIADSALFRLPMGEVNGVTYYAAVRVIDNNSAVNASTAWVNNSNLTTANDIYGDFNPTNVNLQGLVADGQMGMNALNQYRFNGATTANLQPIDDNGNPRSDFTFISPFDAMWTQLVRRMGNPGYNTAGVKYQALPMTECGTLAYHFCLPNPMSSPSVLENALPLSLRPTGMRSTPYAASQVLTWFNQLFNYSSETPGIASTYLPRRSLVTGRSGISTFTPNKFTSQGTYNPADSYDFGDLVQVSGSPFNYVCIQPVPANAPADGPSLSRDNSFWAVEPWTDHITKTPVNSATFDQAWLAYWNVMTDSTGNVPVADQTTLDRNPIRNPQETVPANGNPVAGSLTPSGGDDTANIQNVINSSSPGSTINFAPGTFHVSSTLTFLNDRTYQGAGGGLPPSLTPPEVLKLRAALAAANALTQRGGGNDVISHLVFLGPPASGASSGTGTSTITWGSGSGNQFLVTTPTPAQNISIVGLTFDGGEVQINGNANNVTLLDCTLPGLPFPVGKVANNITITGNQFKNGNGFDYIDNNPCGNNWTITNNTFACAGNEDAGQTVEAFHLVDGHPAGLTISNNTITGSCRCAIEIQCQATNGVCSGNYIHQPNLQSGAQAYIGISWACGPSAVVPGGQPAAGATFSTGCKISGNVIDNTDGAFPVPISADWSQVQGIEFMGNGGTVSGNWIRNAGFNAYTWTTGFTSTNNSWVGYTGPKAWNGEPSGSGSYATPPTIIGDQSYTLANAPARPTAGATAGTPPTIPTTNSTTTYSVMVYGTARNPYMTRVYADNDSSLPNAGYIAIELYNPYNTPITLTNWQLATLSRPSGVVVGVPLTPLNSTVAWASAAPTIPPHGFITLASSASPPPQYSGTPPTSTGSSLVVLSDLNSAFNNELVLLRPRRADGTLTSSTDPNNTYNETANVQDLVPVDSYDFTGLTSPSDPAGTIGGTNPAQEWYYTRPDDPTAGFAWHMVYPGAYSIAAATANGATQGMPRLTATKVGPLDASGLEPFGMANSTPTYNDTPIQLTNDQAPSPNAVAASGNLYPFGGFARNGDLLHCPFIGAYRIQTNDTPTELVELNPVTIDSTYAKIADPTIDSVTPGENIGRFTPIYPPNPSAAPPAAIPTITTGVNDYWPTATYTPPNPPPNFTPIQMWTPYQFGFQLYDYLTTNAPVDWTPNALNATWQGSNIATYAPDSANFPNVDPNPSNQFGVPAYPGPAPQPVTTAKASALNPTSPTDDTIPLEGLININTAPWPVIATLPMVDDPVANANLAQAIVYFRDVDDGTTPGTPHPHGPFKTIWELNEVAVNTQSINGGTPTSNTINHGGPISFLQTVGPFNTNNYLPATTVGTNEAGDLSPQGSSNQVLNDFESQNLALTRISNLITTRSDLYTVYVLVQGWRNVGTANPSLVVQRRAAFLADRTKITSTNDQMTITNIPND